MKIKQEYIDFVLQLVAVQWFSNIIFLWFYNLASPYNIEMGFLNNGISTYQSAIFIMFTLPLMILYHGLKSRYVCSDQ